MSLLGRLWGIPRENFVLSAGRTDQGQSGEAQAIGPTVYSKVFLLLSRSSNGLERSSDTREAVGSIPTGTIGPVMVST